MSSVSISFLVTSLLSLMGASLLGIIGTVLHSLSFCIWWILYLVGWLLRSGELGQFSFHLFDKGLFLLLLNLSLVQVSALFLSSWLLKKSGAWCVCRLTTSWLSMMHCALCLTVGTFRR